MNYEKINENINSQLKSYGYFYSSEFNSWRLLKSDKDFSKKTERRLIAYYYDNIFDVDYIVEKMYSKFKRSIAKISNENDVPSRDVILSIMQNKIECDKFDEERIKLKVKVILALEKYIVEYNRLFELAYNKENTVEKKELNEKLKAKGIAKEFNLFSPDCFFAYMFNEFPVFQLKINEVKI
jgi:hypothetical protein